MQKLFSVLILAVGVLVAKADSLTYTVTPDVGEFSYAFLLTNTGDTGGTLFDLFLSIPLDISDIDTTTIETPVGWGDPTGGLLFFGPDVSPSTSFIEWSDDVSGLYDVAIGNSLGGFSFLSSDEITGPITFSLNGSSTPSVAKTVSSAPEPRFPVAWLASAILLGIAPRETKWLIRKRPKIKWRPEHQKGKPGKN